MEEKSLIDEKEQTKHERQCENLKQKILEHEKRTKDYILDAFIQFQDTPSSLHRLLGIRRDVLHNTKANDTNSATVLRLMKKIHWTLLENLFLDPALKPLVQDQMRQEINMLKSHIKERGAFPHKHPWGDNAKTIVHLQKKIFDRLWQFLFNQWYKGLNQEDWKFIDQQEGVQKMFHQRQQLMMRYETQCYQRDVERAAAELQKMTQEIEESFSQT